MAVSTWSLWLQPEQACAAELEAVIARLAAVHDTAVFPAHLTLLGPLRCGAAAAVRGLDRVAEALSPLDVEFGDVRCEPVWQRSVYLAAVPSPALRQAAEEGVRAFSAPGQPEFMPHLSLQYSESPLAEKRRLASGLALRLPFSVRFDRLSLWQTEGSDARRWRLRAARTLTG
jgi:2'-5' RNA ligase